MMQLDEYRIPARPLEELCRVSVARAVMAGLWVGASVVVLSLLHGGLS